VPFRAGRGTRRHGRLGFLLRLRWDDAVDTATQRAADNAHSVTGHVTIQPGPQRVEYGRRTNVGLDLWLTSEESPSL
jgi:hypothetical protein